MTASPNLPTSRKRKNSSVNHIEEPSPKRMAEAQLLDAINGIKASVNAMEAQLRNVPSKDDLTAIVTEIRGVKETVIRNTDRIDTLFDIRKDDQRVLAKRVEKIVEEKMTASTGSSRNGGKDNNEDKFLLSRRSIRLWPVQNTGSGLDKAARAFFKNTLKIPDLVADGLTIEKTEAISQTRRSKIQGEVLVQLKSSHERDVVQSYASNLSDVQGEAGIRLDVPDHLRGIFRQFETHAAKLRAKYGRIKRAIRFDDVNKSLYMDVKLETTQWHRISAEEISKIRPDANNLNQDNTGLASNVSEKKKILLEEDTQPYTVTDGEESSDSNYQDARK